MSCTNTHLTVNPLSFYKHSQCNLLYMIISLYRNKVLYNALFLSVLITSFTEDFAYEQKSSKV